jgi:hypothetical protein
LLSESVGLAAILGRLLPGKDRLAQAGSPREAAERGGLAGADAVVLDAPPDGRLGAVEQLRRDYQGPLVVLVEPGAVAGDLLQDEAATLLARPFAAEDLGTALGLPPLPPLGDTWPLAKPDQGEPPPAGGGLGDRDMAAALDRVAAARLAAAQRPGGWAAADPPDRSAWWRLRHRLETLPEELVHAWRARRWVRMAGFWGVCLLAFLVAFVLAARHDSLGVVDVTPLPTVEVGAPAAPSTTVRPPATSAGRAGMPGTGGFRGAYITSTTTAAPVTTTVGAVPGGGATTRPATTRRATTTTVGQATTTTNDQATTTTGPTVT